MTQASQPRPTRHLHDLGEQIVQSFGMPLPKFVQRPEVRLRASRQITKSQVLAHSLLQPPRTRDPQGISVKPDPDHQSRVIAGLPFLPVSRQEGAR